MYMRGAQQCLIHFVARAFFCVCVCLTEKRLFAQELYLHSQALFGRTKLIPGPFLGRVHQLSHSPQTLCTQQGHSRGLLLCCSPPQWHTAAILWECLKSLVEGSGWFAFYMLTLYFHLHPPPVFSHCRMLWLCFSSPFLKVTQQCSEHWRSPAVDRLWAAGGNHRLTTKKGWDRLNRSSPYVQSDRPNCHSWLYFHSASLWQECRENSACLLAEIFAQQTRVSICQLHFLHWTDFWTQEESVNRSVWDVSFPHY